MRTKPFKILSYKYHYILKKKKHKKFFYLKKKKKKKKKNSYFIIQRKKWLLDYMFEKYFLEKINYLNQKIIHFLFMSYESHFLFLNYIQFFLKWKFVI